MRLLMTCSPGAGHVFPFVALARIAMREGHEVKIATGVAYQAVIEEAGIPFHSAGLDWNTSTIDPREGGSMMWGKSPPVFTRSLLDLFETWRPDVVVREHTEFGGWLAAEKAGIPYAVLAQGLPGNPANVPPQAVARLNETRRSLGLPPITDTGTSHRYLFLELLPPSWVQHRGYSPKTLHHIPPLLYTPARDWEAPEWLKKLGDRPLIFCTMGTVFNRNSDLFAALVEALTPFDADAVIATGKNFTKSRELTTPEHIHVHSFVPLSQIMDRCRLVVCHGGLGTTLHALSHGVPLVTIPIGANQPMIAAHVARSGVGSRVLGSESQQTRWGPAANPEAVTAEHVRKVVAEVLSDATYTERARDLRHEMQSIGDDVKAIHLLDKLARTGECLTA